MLLYFLNGLSSQVGIMSYTEEKVSRAARLLAKRINTLRSRSGLAGKPIRFGFATASRTSVAARLLKPDMHDRLHDLVHDCQHEWHIGQYRDDVDILGEPVTIMISAIEFPVV